MVVDEEALGDRIEATKDELFALTERLVSAKSIVGDEAPAQAVVIEEFESLGLEPDVWEPDLESLSDHPGFFVTSSYEDHGYDGRPNVAAVRTGSGDGRSLGFSGHVDVVAVEPDNWTFDPWTPTVEGGKLYGRGACDMKGGIAAFIHAVKALDSLDVQLAGDLVLQTTIEEEAGGVGGVLSALLRGYQPDAAIIPEPYAIPNVGIASAGVMYFRLRVPGKAAHAARGYEGVNAIEKAITLCDALVALDRERKARISYEPVLRRTPEATTGGTTSFIGGAAGLDERYYNRYFDIPCPTVGPRGGNAHGADEYVELDSLVETAQTLALVAVDWCGTVENG